MGEGKWLTQPSRKEGVITPPGGVRPWKIFGRGVLLGL